MKDPFPFFTAEIAREAVQKIRKKVEAYIEKHGGNGAYIGVLHPSVEYSAALAKSGFKSKHIICDSKITPEKWGGSNFEEIGKAKCILSLRKGVNSGDVPRHRLRRGDCRYMGCVNYKGILVFISGLPQLKDHKFALKGAKLIKKGGDKAFNKWVKKNSGVALV